MADVARTHDELDALLAQKLGPLLEELSREHSIVVAAVCVVVDTRVLNVLSTMSPPVERMALTAVLDAYQKPAVD